jgi:amidase
VIQQRMMDLMKQWQLDAVVYPYETKPAKTIEEAAPNKGETVVSDPFDNRVPGGGNRLSTVSGLPTIVVPAGFNKDGVGVALEILGKLYDEATVIRLAYAYEQAAPNRKLPKTTPLLGIEKIEY